MRHHCALTDLDVALVCIRLKPTYDVPLGAMKAALDPLFITSPELDGTFNLTTDHMMDVLGVAINSIEDSRGFLGYDPESAEALQSALAKHYAKRRVP